MLGVDILRDRAFREYDLIEFGGGRGSRRRRNSCACCSTRDRCSHRRSSRGVTAFEWAIRIELDIGDRRRAFVVRGLLANDGPARVLDGNFVLMDIAAAQWAFDRLGRVDRVEIRLPDGRDVGASRAAHRRRVCRPGSPCSGPRGAASRSKRCCGRFTSI